MESLNVVIPSTPLPWWLTSNIAKWRHLIDIPGIRDAPAAQDLAIFDWKILFEISLRQPTSIWRLSPSITFGQVQVPILGIIQEVDFVANRAVFRLHSHTIKLLLTHHAEYTRQRKLPPQQEGRIRQTFACRLDILQVKLNAAVLVCTDGEYARGDFPVYAADPRANVNILRMLNLVLKESGLRKIILDAFVELQSSIPTFVFGPGGLLGGAGTIAPKLISSSSEAPGCSGGHVSPEAMGFPYHDLDVMIYGKGGQVQSAGSIIPHAPSSSSKRKRQSSGDTVKTNKRRRHANIIEDVRGGKSRRPSIVAELPSVKIAIPQIVNNSGSKHKVTIPSPLATEIKQTIENSPPPPSCCAVEEIIGSPRARKSPSTSASSDSGIFIQSVPDEEVTPSAAEVTQQSSTPDELETVTSTPEPPLLSDESMKQSPRVDLDLNHDELKIFNMDSSFAPVTRRQAAMANKQTVNLKDMKVKRVSLVKTSLRDISPTQDTAEEVRQENKNSKKKNKDTAPTAVPKTAKKQPKQEEPEPESESEPETSLLDQHLALNHFDFRLEDPMDIAARDEKFLEPEEKVSSSDSSSLASLEKDDEDYTDEDDNILDSDTPDIELLVDSADEAEHRDRKIRRRQRKQRKREEREREEGEVRRWMEREENQRPSKDVVEWYGNKNNKLGLI
ncbi:hypothetical protein H072_10400 [Dactylellina haptotyla CBS 200.50]|uniref:Uncharacterized protein n=1 Tax=Dactylellina haptotyla (strain CBS 200.50) TaxID=1284197 RepID=S7ZZZ0_DACHA|nr:hypothetical protein H072_10400 [Dactylellina haptotyla CBS 200.50]